MQIEDDSGDECSATLKRVFRDKKRKRFRLHPENDTMEDFYAKDIEIIGIAVKVLKNLR